MIRPVTPADISALKTVIDSSELFPSELLDDMIAPFFTDPTSPDTWLTYDAGEGPVAIAYFAPEQMTLGTWNLYLIAVHPSQQSKGIGAAIMGQVEQSLAARGERILIVETSGLDAFSRTRKFYQELGYNEEARIREFYAAGEDKVIFWKKL